MTKRITNHVEIADMLNTQHVFISCADRLYEFKDGRYKELDDRKVYKYIKDIIGDDYTPHKAKSVLEILKVDHFVEIEELNNSDLLNLKNGLFDLENKELLAHTPNLYSTIQLNVNYDEDVVCPKWLEFLDDVLEGNTEKIKVLQEFFGLCLTKITKFEKALILLGDGANGKSVIVYILQKLVGEENYSAVSLEKLKNSHYIANLFSKTMNTSIEISSKLKIKEDIFKTIVTGEPMEADEKFKKPFKFSPYCKLVIALNEFPYIDDKSGAYYRRILLIKFNKQISEEKQNKDLKYQLEDELDGIFLWALEGLHRLLERGTFKMSANMKDLIECYRIENDRVAQFTKECCKIDEGKEVSKDKLYEAYSRWTISSGYKKFGKHGFGKQLQKSHKDITDERTAERRFWSGISLNDKDDR